MSVKVYAMKYGVSLLMPWTQKSGLYQQGLSLSRPASTDKNVHFRPGSHRTLSVRLESCLPPALWPGLPGRLTSPFQSLLLWGYNLGNHTEQSLTSPPFLFVKANTVVSPMKPATCSSHIWSLENNLYMQKKVLKIIPVFVWLSLFDID